MWEWLCPSVQTLKTTTNNFPIGDMLMKGHAQIVLIVRICL
ncbi:hypothetical protein VPHPS32B4_0064 [Vibrio phage PS32B-4]